jgi:hypothetical protein
MQYIIMTEMIYYQYWVENVVEYFGSCSNSMATSFLFFREINFWKIHKAIFYSYAFVLAHLVTHVYKVTYFDNIIWKIQMFLKLK